MEALEFNGFQTLALYLYFIFININIIFYKIKFIN
jgi:hypothetical protein